MGAKIKIQNPKKSLGLQTKPKKIPGPKLNPEKPHAEFPSHRNFQKALNDVTQKIETLVMECLCFFIHHTIWSKNLFRIW